MQCDIDLLIEFEDNTQYLYDLKIQFKDFIKKIPGVSVDICQENYIKPGIKSSILKEAIYAD